MLIKVKTQMNFHGRLFRAGHYRNIPDEEVQEFVTAGYVQHILPDAEAALVETAAALMKSLGGGLLVLPQTDPELIEAAKSENLKLAKAKK